MSNNYNSSIQESKSNKPFINMCKDDDTGKIIITDYNNNKYESDIFGRKLQNFLPKITGVMSGSTRAKIKQVKSKNENENFSKKKNDINYHPTVKRMEGFSSFPRPISLPFYNIPDFEIKNNLKKNINEKIKQYYKVERNIINKRNNNKSILSYLTKDLNMYNAGNKNKEKLLDLVDRNMDELKEEYKIKLSALHKNPNYIAMNQFKKRILFSKKTEEENNNKLNEPSDGIKKTYHIIHNIIKNNSSKRNNKSFSKKEISDINKYIKNKIKEKSINKSNTSSISRDSEKGKYRKINIINNKYKRKNMIIGPDKLNNIFRSKDFGIGRSIKMDFGNYSYEESKKIPPILIDNTNNIDLSQDKDKENESYLPKISNNINNDMNRNKSKENLYQDKDTAETVSNMNRNNTEIRIIDEKIEEDELSFISRENEIENKNNKKTNIRSNKFLKNYCQHEKELLEGIKIETPREEAEVLPKRKKNVLKNNGQLYREDIALLKLTNPKRYQIMEQKNEYDMKLLIKKLGRNRKDMEVKTKE